MKRNTSGKADPKFYRLGRGIVQAAFLDANGKPKGYRDLGNSPEFGVTVEAETLEHQSSRTGLKKKDLELVLSQDVSLSFQLEEISAENVALFFAGDVSQKENLTKDGMGATGAGIVVIEKGDIELGTWIDIIDASGNRAYDIDGLDLELLTVDAAGSTQAVVPNTSDADYEVDKEMGRLFLKESSTVLQTAVTDGDGLAVYIAAAGSAPDKLDVVTPLTKSRTTVAIKFLAENANSETNDPRTEMNFWNVVLTPDGDMPLISDEIASMGFNGACTQSTWSSLNGETCRFVTPVGYNG